MNGKTSGGDRSLSAGVIRFLVWTAIIATIATPVVMMVVLNLQIGRGLIPDFLGQFGSVDRDGRRSPPSITTSLPEAERTRQINRLKAMTGTPEMASGAARSLQVIAIRFDGAKPVWGQAGARESIYKDGYWRMELDMSDAQRQAVLLVVDEPVRWTVTGQTRGAWPLVAFEGRAAFDIASAENGSLAGFRIGEFGASNILRAVDPTNKKTMDRHRFCDAAERWSDFFAVPYDSVRFLLTVNARHIAVGRSSAQSDGREMRSLSRSEVKRLCWN